MKRILLTLSFIAFAIANVMAERNFDFSAECSSGQILYYKIISKVEPYTVAVTYAEESKSVNGTRVFYYSGYTEPSGNLVIPEKVIYNNIEYAVIKIDDHAFHWLSELISVIIPESITSIGQEAFYSCSNLGNISIPNSIKQVGNNVFTGCNKLKYNISNNACYLGNTNNKYLFLIKAYSYNISSCIVDSNCKFIHSYAFQNCASLTLIYVPQSVISVGALALNGCSNLRRVFCEANSKPSGWDANWKNTGGSVFWNIKNINGLLYQITSNSPRAVTIVGYMGNGKDITIPSKVTLGVSDYSVTSIDADAFKNLPTLESINIPETVTNIKEYAFYGCSGLTSITIPNSVTNIGNYAFSNCSKLSSIIIPNSVTSIGSSTFSGCSGLTSVTIPNSISKIQAYTFSGCSSLQSLDIPSSVTMVYGNIVDDCSNLQYISMHSSTPPTITGTTFSSLDASFPIYIPCGSLSAYNSANYWKGKNFIEDFVYKLELEPDDAAMGSAEIVTAPTCGEAAVIKAVSNRYFEFTQWSDGNTDNPRSILITQDTRITANFQYHLVATVESSDESMGEVSESSGVFNNITDIEISATPAYGYHFTQWSDGVTTNPRVVRLSTDTLLRAQFAPNPHNIILKTNDASLGTVDGGGVFDYNSLHTITAEATIAGYRFGKWSDGNMENPRKILLTSDTTLTAIFVEDRLYDVDVTTQDSAKGKVSGSGKYDYGTEVILQATPAENCYFVQWSDGSSSNPRVLLVETDVNLVAKFDTLQIFNIQVQASDTARGTVSGSGKFVSGTEASLSATPRQHFIFSQWSDGRTDNPRTIRVISDATYTAVFEPEKYNLTLVQNNSDMGMVSGSGVYSYGDVVSCLAKPYDNYHFVQWSNGETANPYEFVIEGNQLLTAYFAAGAVTGISDDAAAEPIIYAVGKTIIVENATNEILVYDAMGRLIGRDVARNVSTINVGKSGVYVVKVGNMVKRVMIND